jgi:hypothetical protein
MAWLWGAGLNPIGNMTKLSKTASFENRCLKFLLVRKTKLISVHLSSSLVWLRLRIHQVTAALFVFGFKKLYSIRELPLYCM